MIAEQHTGSDDKLFLEDQLYRHSADFSREDLHTLIRLYPRPDHPIHELAVEQLSRYVTSLADRLAAEQPGMSNDIATLKQSITNYGFSSELKEALQKVDEELAQSGDAFDQTATMKHIRSFFEKLHESVGKELQTRRPNIGNGTPLRQFGQAIDYLERKQVITSKLHSLAKCLYAILSDGDYGVHALKAKRDYSRLCRNMVVEYAVTLFFELERRLKEPGDA